MVRISKRTSLYTKWVFPWLCDRMMDQPFLERHRREQLASVCGEVLEIGVGTGLNLACYPPAVRKLTVVEPNAGMNAKLRQRIEQTGIKVEQRNACGEELPFPDQSFDFVVSTFTLCSIADVERALKEVHRVLAPGGQFVFLEHGLNPEPKIQKWQRRLNWVQGIFGDGCRLDLDIRRLLAAAPFASLEVENFHLDNTPRTHGFLYRGVAGRD